MLIIANQMDLQSVLIVINESFMLETWDEFSRKPTGKAAIDSSYFDTSNGGNKTHHCLLTALYESKKTRKQWRASK